MKKLLKSRSVRQPDKIIFSSGESRVTMPDELNEIVQYKIAKQSSSSSQA